ncbi:glycoside hydrolase family 16 protein [Leeuwenhoekiella marinoflava]|uniref:Fibronectin type-III domain-containing protein n=2 Tax=Leeuwenhoekiella marinoflava TaxID=988 RepID=A0A4Q0PIU4_9FLAO|nr:hypothetical protein [Leeuwenhoekiella marinoflava]RXG27177.1 hypothetical protein DSL99_2969 [Leeuwenhoekiella marinoflava]SHF77742.1 hypothetical protein SAMN02745246_03365 [Leeuwenhoekiella marinoflava DSM 3653]
MKSSYIEKLYLLGIILVLFSCSDENNNDLASIEKPDIEVTGQVPTVQIEQVINILESSMTITAYITDNGGASVLSRGISVSVKEELAESDTQFAANTVKASGEFTTDISGLKENTTYFIRAYAENKAGIAYGDVISVVTKAEVKPVIIVDSESFTSQDKFDETWNMLYPWGSDHNGSARMFSDNVSLKEGGVLEIIAKWTNWEWEGYSTADPHLRITFHSGAIHAKDKIRVTEELPYWEISGEFMAPTVPSSWPAFWISGSDSWPPEVDILEFKGTTSNLQNTVTGPSWDKTIWTTVLTDVPDAATSWHSYKLILRRIDEIDTAVNMYIDGELRSSEIKDYTNKPFWLIINMQMEGASGATNDESIVRSEDQVFSARNIKVVATPQAQN